MVCSEEFRIFHVRGLARCALLVLSLATMQAQTTNIAIGTNVLQSSVKRLGINLSFQDYYDSGQMTKNLVSRNPGFEGEIYQSTIRCISGTAMTCVDDDANSAWPAGFWNGATVEFFYGSAQGRTGIVAAYTAANGASGGTFTFSSSGATPATGDYMIVRMVVPGNAAAGWWPASSGNGTITTNTSDLPPGTTGLQTAALNAPAASDSASLAAYFDGEAGRSFVLLKGTFQLSFQAKGIGGSSAIALNLQRIGLATYLNQTVQLSSTWTTYTFTFTGSESGAALNNVALTFSTVGQDAFLLDNVSLTQTDSDPSNATAFRDPVVNTLESLHPGVLRFWANQLGDTLDNLIADPYARQRAGYLAWYTEQDDISYGLQEFLQLCATVGAEPWFVVPSTFSTADAANLIEYLAGAPSTPYGSKRAARGQTTPWTSVFTRIHLEFGNEAWNSTFKGGSIEYSAPYGQRAQAIFGAMRGDSAYLPSAFDLVLGGQAAWAGRNQDIQNNCNNNDSFAVAPYMMNTLDSFSTNENLFGPTFAEPEAFQSPAGVAEGVTGGLMLLNQQAIAGSSHPVPLSLYEVNLSPLGGAITQAALNSYAPSLGAGLAVVDNMLQQMRQGVLTQNLFALPQYEFLRSDGKTVFLWGSVVDMGVTDQRRPQFLALQLANQAIGQNATMLQTVHSGADPTWDQPLVNSVQLTGAHYLQSFAFSSSSTTSLVIFNLHRTAALPVTFSGANAPGGNVQLTQLTSANITDTNEASEVISPVSSSLANFSPLSGITLPPYSMTVLAWVAGPTTPPPPAAPGTPPVISAVSATPAASTSATVTWTTDQPSSSQVEYGTSASYGTLSVFDPSLVTSHSVNLSGLTPATSYDYAVISASANGSTTSSSFTFSTPAAAPIARVGGAHSNTGNASAATSLSIPYSSGNGNTVVAVCALGNVSSTISSITDSGSTWSLRAAVNNGTAVRSEIWSTTAGGSVASSSFTVNVSGGSPLSCALEEYSGVLSIGATNTNEATSGAASVSLTTQDSNDYIVAGFGANSYNGYTVTSGALAQFAGVTSNSGGDYVEMTMCDMAVPAATTVACAAAAGSSPWAAPALALRSIITGSIPSITGVTGSGITATSATITWTTDQPSSSQVEFGTTASYGSYSAYNTAFSTTHSVILTGLIPGTTYDYAALSTNPGGTMATSHNFTFATQTAPPAIQGVTVGSITPTSAMVTWTTDQASTSQVQFGTTTAYGSVSIQNAAMATSHSVTLTGLTPGTTYDFEVMSTNSASLSNQSPNATFTTATAGPAPNVQNVVFWGITGNSITIAWYTDQPSTTFVQYGITSALGQTSPVQTALSQNHQLVLSGLSDGATYYFSAQSTNASNVTGSSAIYTFQTLDTSPPVISNVQATPAVGNTASFSWSLSKAATSQVEYGTNTYYGLWSGTTALTQNPQVTLSWVPSGTIHYRIHSTDAHGNQATSPDYSFTEP